jgi:hypothetical protein
MSNLLDGGLQENIWAGGAVTVYGVTLNATLTGTLTIYGITQSNGQPQSWVIGAASPAGYYAPPGTGNTGGNLLAYAFSNAADQGKAFISYR